MNDRPPTADEIASAILAKLFRFVTGVFLIIWVGYFLREGFESIKENSRKIEEIQPMPAPTTSSSSEKTEDEEASRSIRTGSLDRKQ
jgi:hypothetical protein